MTSEYMVGNSYFGITSALPVSRAECRAYCQSVVTAKRAESICLLRDSCFPADSYFMARLLSTIVLACRSGFKRRVEFLEFVEGR